MTRVAAVCNEGGNDEIAPCKGRNTDLVGRVRCRLSHCSGSLPDLDQDKRTVQEVRAGRDNFVFCTDKNAQNYN